MPVIGNPPVTPDRAMQSRRNALLLALVAGLVMIASAITIAVRVRRFHSENPRELFVFQKLNQREFSFANKPVKLTDDRTGKVPTLVLSFGDAIERIVMTVPPEPTSPRWSLPDLLPHEDWLRVLRMAPAAGLQPQEFVDKLNAGELDERLLLVARVPKPGTDPKTWGSVWKKGWSFDFYELGRDGSIITHPRLKYPTTRGIKKRKDGELQENTWQYQAAMQTMPQAGSIGPTINFFGNAIAAAGWALPLSAFSGLVCTFAVAFAFAPRKRTAQA